MQIPPRDAAAPAYFGSAPAGPPGVPGGLMTGVEFGFGTGAGLLIPGSTLVDGVITPFEAFSLSLNCPSAPEAEFGVIGAPFFSGMT